MYSRCMRSCELSVAACKGMEKATHHILWLTPVADGEEVELRLEHECDLGLAAEDGTWSVIVFCKDRYERLRYTHHVGHGVIVGMSSVLGEPQPRTMTHIASTGLPAFVST